MGKKIIFSLLAICLVAGMVGVGTWAYFSDIETSPGQVFQAGTLDLEVSGENPLTKTFFTVGPAKPGDKGDVPINLSNVGNIDGVAYIRITGLADFENDTTEPEEEADVTPGGDLSAALDIVIAADLTEAPGYETPIALGTLKELAAIAEPFNIGLLEGVSAFDIDIAWSIDGETVGNEIQDDSCEFTIEFTLEQAVDFPPTVVVTPFEPDNEFDLGEEITITADVTDDIGLVGVAFYIDDPLADPHYMVPTAPEEWPGTNTYQGTWYTAAEPVAPGPHLIIVGALDLGGNKVGVPVPVTIHGAMAELSDLTFNPPDALLLGTEYTVSVTLKNVGDVDGTWDVTMEIDGWTPLAAVDVALIGGGFEVLTFGVGEEWVPDEGDYTVTVTAAPDPTTPNAIGDTLEKAVHVYAVLPPTLAVGDTWVFDSKYYYYDVEKGMRPPFEMSGDATAGSTTDEFYSGSYSVELTLPAGATVEDAARVVIPAPAGTVLDGISGLSFWWHSPTSGDIPYPYAIFEMDVSGNGEADTWVVNLIHLQEPYIVSGPVAWEQRTLPGDNDLWHVVTTIPAGYSVTQWEPVSLATVKEHIGSEAVLSYKVAIGQGAWPQYTVYIDDITVNGDLYELEPPALPTEDDTETTVMTAMWPADTYDSAYATGETFTLPEDCYRLETSFVNDADGDVNRITLLGLVTMDPTKPALTWTAQNTLDEVYREAFVHTADYDLVTLFTWDYFDTSTGKPTADHGWPYDLGKEWGVWTVTLVYIEPAHVPFADIYSAGLVRVEDETSVTVPAGTFTCKHLVTYEVMAPLMKPITPPPPPGAGEWVAGAVTSESWQNDDVKFRVRYIDRTTYTGELVDVLIDTNVIP